MTVADQKQSSVVRTAETSWGVTPASGDSRVINFINARLKTTKETTESGGIRPDLSIKGIIETTHFSGMEMDFELSAGSHDDFLEAALSSTWTRPLTFDFFEGATVQWTGISEITIDDVDLTDYYSIGDIFKTEKFTNSVNNGYFNISGVLFDGTDTVLTVTQSTSIIESGNEFGIIMDADDVTVQSSNIRLGTAGADTIDSNGNNDFAAAIAAGELAVGQKIFVDLPIGPVAFDNQTITLTGPFTAGDAISFDDGVDLVYLFAGVDFAIGANLTAAATNLAAAINSEAQVGRIRASASSAAGVVTIYYLTDLVGAATEIVDAGGTITISSLTSATGSSGRGFFTLSAVSDDVLTVSTTPPTEASPGAVVIKASMLRNPSSRSAVIKRSFSQEMIFADIDDSLLQDGMRVDVFSTVADVGNIITGEVKLVGRKSTPNASPLLSSIAYNTLTAVKTAPIHTLSNLGDVYQDGIPVVTAIDALTMDIQSNIEPQLAIGTKYPIDVSPGTMQITGTIDTFFESIDMYNEFVNHTTISLSWYYQDEKSNTYYYTFPSIKIEDELVEIRGVTTEDVQAGVTDKSDWRAIRDPNTGCLIQIDRFSSIDPV